MTRRHLAAVRRTYIQKYNRNALTPLKNMKLKISHYNILKKKKRKRKKANAVSIAELSSQQKLSKGNYYPEALTTYLTF